MTRLNQHDFVRQCLERYAADGSHPGDGDKWDDAHYPAPKGIGHQKIKLKHWDHQVQGLLQSEEYGRVCFFAGDAKRFLDSGPFVEGWFELYEIFAKYAAVNAEQTNKKLTFEQRSEVMRRVHASRTTEERAKLAKKIQENRTFEQRSEASKRANASLSEEQKAEKAQKISEKIRKYNASLTDAQRSERSQNGSESVKKRNEKLTPEERSEASRRANAKLTPEQRSERAKKSNAGRKKTITLVDTLTAKVIRARTHDEMALHIGVSRRSIRRFVASGQILLKRRYALYLP